MATRWLAGIRQNWILASIVLLGLVVRLWGIGYGLPYTYAPDEPTYLSITLRMLQTGDLNPHWWYYPSLMFYIQGIAFVVYFAVGRMFGLFATPADIPLPEVITMGVGRLSMPSEFLLARGLTAAFSAAGIVLVYLIGRRAHPNKWADILAGLFFAVSPTIMDSSQRIGPDILALFFSLISFYFVLKMDDSPILRNYILAGVGAGLAVSAKYNVALILIPLVVAHMLRHGSDFWKHPEILAAFSSAGIAFVIGTPFSLLDFAGFWDGVRFQAFSYSVEGHVGQEGDALRWYVDYLIGPERWITASAVACAVGALVTRSRKHLILVSYPLAYFAFVSVMYVRNTRTIMQIIPFLEVLSAIGITTAFEWLLLEARWKRPIVIAAGIVLVTLMAAPPLQGIVAADINSGDLGDRETARVWIEQNLPPGSRIALEAYAPYVDPRRYTVYGEYGLTEHAPEWYTQNGFEYLVFSYGSYGRYFEDSARYSEAADDYGRLFAAFPEVYRSGGIRIARTNTNVLPEHRVGALWGVYSPWLDLVGYDWKAPTLTLYWRIVQARREQLVLTARLLGDEGPDISSSAVVLFAGEDTQLKLSEGILHTQLTIDAPVRAMPGVYRLELDMDSVALGRVPILGLDGKPISDKLIVGGVAVPSQPPISADWNAAQSVGVTFGDSIRLERVLRDPAQPSTSVRQFRPGGSISLTLFWRGIAQIAKDYTVFVHLVDADGDVRAQVDAMPFGGRYPTSAWNVDEILSDKYNIALPGDLAPGAYAIQVGLYEYPSMARLLATDGQGSLIGDSVTVGEKLQVAP